MPTAKIQAQRKTGLLFLKKKKKKYFNTLSNKSFLVLFFKKARFLPAVRIAPVEPIDAD